MKYELLDDTMRANVLTIGIPTHNRVTGVTQHAKKLIAESVHDVAEVLIIDNASTDGTFESLREICDGTSIRVLRNDRNLGYRGNFLRLFEECETEYLMVTSDEEPVIPANLGAFVQFLKTHRPLFVSPQYYRREQPAGLFRGQMATRRIVPYEFLFCSAHMPGLAYRTQESKEVLSDIKTHLEKDELKAYPQALLAAGLILRGPCFWWDKPIVHQEYDFPRLHGIFNHVSQRWDQHKGFVDFFKEMVENASDPATKRIATQMLKAQQEGLIHRLRSAIELERPDLLPPFDRSARSFYKDKHPLRSMAGKYVRGVRHPAASWRALRRKIGRYR